MKKTIDQPWSPPKTDGFTLIELLVVIGIITILASLAFAGIPRIIMSVKRVKCEDNLRSLYAALQIYAEERSYGGYPQVKGTAFWESLRTYPTPETAILKSPLDDRYFICPVVGGQGGKEVCHYRGPKEFLNSATDGHTPIAADFPENHGKYPITVLLFDGRRESVKTNDYLWTEAEKWTVK
ncbi:MAG: prepilin-type N-terminal cleavage/methylation domain-containing protein [Planctomycetota bacterium]